MDLVNEPTRFKNVDNPSCIDLILANKPQYFQKTTVVETGISNNNDNFRNDLLYELSVTGFRDISCGEFENMVITMLNKHAPLLRKMRCIRANNSPFMNNNLSKAIMLRSRLRYKFLKLKTEESRNAYKKQRHFCVSSNKDKKRII